LVLASYVCVIGAALWIWITPTDGGDDRPDDHQRKIGGIRVANVEDPRIQ